MSKRPSFQFYPSDWRTEAGLRLCSLAARGLWIEMLTLMHDGEPYGHLTIDGEQISVEMLSRLIGETPNLVKKLLKELEARKVFSRTDDGMIFSRRMVRDEDARERRAAGGSAGAAHGYKGASHGSKGGRPRKDKTPETEKLRGDKKPPSTPVSKPSPSSSSSSSTPLPPSTISRAGLSGSTRPITINGQKHIRSSPT
ncbi:hypothetical protein F1640_15020 [Novosphingobium sp. NBM11]|uniref:hypothetical protein n=1 Tax=Novosphingobium sp. NBM11 TaxID=2596914 RepID=UPI0018920ADC|nr:hypothetical protein [Novosphingobium sp. NBM11]MBF5091298.1 hypothetical protein [Novosphingobium sp. NBM11]